MKESKDTELAEVVFNEESGAGAGDSAAREAISALTVLGYSQIEAGKAVLKVYKEGMTVEDVIKEALRQG